MTDKDRFDENAFGRRDESDDRRFYASARCVDHLDDQALAKVEKIIGSLVTKKRPVILYLMASLNSHLTGHLKPKELVHILGRCYAKIQEIVHRHGGDSVPI